ncbi:MAG: response regulator receiver protein, partial [Alphaproteobacteria bacterium]|nr:response regulator receiver protein [Alphaproteobacteria bacterium]
RARAGRKQGAALLDPPMRMADAPGELDGLAGPRSHRSWWVARSAIDSVRRGNGRAELTLKGDIVAPLSRFCMPALQPAGGSLSR